MSFLNSVVKSFRPKTFLAMSSALIMVAGMLFGANIATADSVWVQSYERTSQTAACGAQSGETPWQESWGTDSSWSPSWEQWANGGKGGWVCTRSITWARDSAARVYNVGDIGPGGGLVFLISGGLRYEMAPKTWSDGSEDPADDWCSDTSSDITGAEFTPVGTGSSNTTAMQSPACTSGAGVSARAYRGGGFSDWFLPSQDELNAMCNYSRNPSAPAAPSVSCYGTSGVNQNATFASGDYGFASAIYWTSSQAITIAAWIQDFSNGNQDGVFKNVTMRLRPVRVF